MVAHIDRLNQEAWDLRRTEDWAQIAALAEEGLVLARSCGYQRGIAEALRNSFFIDYIQANFAAGSPKAYEALAIAEELDDADMCAMAHTGFCLMHWGLGDYEQSIREGLKAIELYEKGTDRSSQGWALATVGSVYQNIGESEQATHYLLRGKEVLEACDDTLGVARAISGLGLVAQANGDPEMALRYHERALEIYRSLQNRAGEARALNDIGAVHQSLGDFGRALDLHQSSLALRRTFGYKPAEATSLLNLGRVYLAQQRTGEAQAALEEALALATALGAKPKMFPAHQLLSEIHEASGDFGEALRHYREFHRIRDQVFSEQTKVRLRNLQVEVELERTRRQAETHRIRNVELRETNDRLTALLEELKETQARLVQSEKMGAVGSMVAGLAHEINSPLGAIRSACDVSRRCTERIASAVESAPSIEALRTNRQVQKAFELLQTNQELAADAGGRMSRLMESLKSFIRLDQAAYQQVDLNRAIDDTLTLLESEFRGRIEVVREYGELPRIFCYAADLNQVFFHLLRNGAEAIGESGRVRISTGATAESLTLRFHDTGRGIEPDRLRTLFEPQFSRKGSRVRASTSLFTCMSIVRRHNGEIRVESLPGQGTTFAVVLPRSLETQIEAF